MSPGLSEQTAAEAEEEEDREQAESGPFSFPVRFIFSSVSPRPVCFSYSTYKVKTQENEFDCSRSSEAQT